MATTAGASSAVLDRTQSLRWRETWAEVMGLFVPGLATLEEALCRSAEAVHGRTPRRVLDLGGGPGLLAERMARRWPGATVTLMDIDPVLLELARGALGDGVRTVDADLSSSDWVAHDGGDHDLIAMIMTMHYLSPTRAHAFYVDARSSMASGGLLVVADLMPDDGVTSVMSALDPAPDEAAAELAWAQWWSDLAEVAALQPMLTQRAAIFADRPPAEFTAPVSWHVAAARAAGFREAGIIWRCGRHAALAAIA